MAIYWGVRSLTLTTEIFNGSTEFAHHGCSLRRLLLVVVAMLAFHP